MQLIIHLLAFASFTAGNPLENRAPPRCTPDNCLRALTVTDSNLRASRPVMAQSDCSLLMTPTTTTTITVTPTASTVFSEQTNIASITVTTSVLEILVSTVTATSLAQALPARDLSNKRSSMGNVATVPAYLSPCSSLARLSSACSCISITAATVTHTYTLPVLSKTITSSITTTTTVEEATTLSTTTTTYKTPSASPDPLPSGQFYLQVLTEEKSSLGFITSDGSTTGFDVPFISDSPGVICTFDNVSGRITCDNQEGFGQNLGCEQVSALFTSDYLGDEYYFSCSIDKTGYISCALPGLGESADIPWYACGYDALPPPYYLMSGSSSCNAGSGCVAVYLYADGLYNFGLYN